MRKIGWLLVLFLGWSLLGCESIPKATAFRFGGYRVYYQSHGSCEMFVMQPIGEDDDNRYFLTTSGCSVDDYYFIRQGWEFVSVKNALEEGLITLDDVIDSQAPFIMIEAKEEDPL